MTDSRRPLLVTVPGATLRRALEQTPGGVPDGVELREWDLAGPPPVEPGTRIDLVVPPYMGAADRLGARSFSKALASATVHLTDDSAAMIAAPEIDIVIDATGNPAAGIRHVLACCTHGKHVVMVNVEADALAGGAGGGDGGANLGDGVGDGGEHGFRFSDGVALDPGCAARPWAMVGNPFGAGLPRCQLCRKVHLEW